MSDEISPRRQQSNYINGQGFTAPKAETTPPAVVCIAGDRQMNT